MARNIKPATDSDQKAIHEAICHLRNARILTTAAAALLRRGGADRAAARAAETRDMIAGAVASAGGAERHARHRCCRSAA